MRFRNWKTPSAREVAVRPSGMGGPEMETSTPGTGAPASSLTTPWIEPVVWEKATEAKSRHTRNADRDDRRLIDLPPRKTTKEKNGSRISEVCGEILRPFE